MFPVVNSIAWQLAKYKFPGSTYNYESDNGDDDNNDNEADEVDDDDDDDDDDDGDDGGEDDHDGDFEVTYFVFQRNNHYTQTIWVQREFL